MENVNVYVDFKLNIEEGTSLFNVEAQCLIFTEDLDQSVNVGHASFYLINPVKSSYLDVCGDADCISSDLSHSLISLRDICDVESIQGLVATGHFINIKEDWRGKGLGKAFIKKMIEQLTLLNVGIMVLIARNTNEFPYYSELGFQPLKNKADISLMYRYADDINV
ncbi:GNAT family N-acetyltransferase [Bacillus sp. FJAT-22090]|uniref:GNAT family N-acetyltransferase n=1 Tax=Bacillus sp. FJAT-22090 TaxID=1581038 RepID=UPI001642382A|nr:GNAT family N-acetyltransferase [Bacillus sp. FJAT-22090]